MQGVTATARRGESRRVLAFPFHDWRKLQAEGFRTRDAHLMESVARRSDTERVLVVDRPTSLAERVTRRGKPRADGDLERSWRSGDVQASLTRVQPNVRVLDLAFDDLISPVRRRRAWWFDVFARR